MNSDNKRGDSLNDPAFQALLVSCLERLERGESLDRGALLEAHPQHARVLGNFLDDQQLLRQVAGELRDSLPRGQSLFDDRMARTIDSNSDSDPAALVGERIRYIGEYEVLEEVARGGMGVVYKARQHKLDRIVYE